MLVFFTGANAVPPLGFDTQPLVSFLHGQAARLCTASTCELHFRLPTCYGEDYAAFREAMILSLLGNDGFGGV